MAGLIQNLIKGMSENKKEMKEKFKTLQQDRKLHKMLDEREKSSNQRELERHFKEQNENRIKEALDKIRKKQTKDNWKGESILKGHTNILNDDKSVLKSGKSILHQKNIFLDNKTKIPMTGEEIFFKF